MLASDSTALRRICRDHATDLIAAADDPVHGVTERANGVLGIRHSEPLPRFAPFASGSASPPLPARRFRTRSMPTRRPFFAWLHDPEDAELTGVNVAADLVWQERPDLANAFPHVRWSDRDHFVRWLWTHGIAEGLISTALLRACPRARAHGTGPDGRNRPLPAGSASGSTWSATTTPDLGLGVAVRAGSPLRSTPRGSRRPR